MSTSEADSFPLLAGPFSGRATFRERLSQAAARAAQGRWRELVLCDVDFADWPLGERALVDHLSRWASQGGQLIMLAHHYESVPRVSPLFVRWRRNWSHRVQCLALQGMSASDVPSFLWSGAWCVRRIDPARSTGATAGDVRTITRLTEQIMSLRARGKPAFPADVLGL